MSGLWRKLLLLGGLFTGLCLPAQANTTANDAAVPQPASSSTVTTSAVDLSSTETLTAIALLLPLRSDMLREPAEVLRAGFQAAYERDGGGIAINLIETSDAPQDILSAYKAASADNDIVVGPLTRSGVGAVAHSGGVVKPTIALTSPDTPDGTDAALPRQLLVMGLSIEEEARQVADWARRERKQGKALVLHTPAAWQRRAAKAFETQWTRHGREAASLEIGANDGFLAGRDLLQLKKQFESDKPALLFLALDARQARQVRAVMGKELPLYGTSQLNPVALTDRDGAERLDDMDGARLLDIPWQLQADHPAVMVYPRQVVDADKRRSADLERLYALGIDAYRVAREIASRHTSFQLDGVTGKLTVRFDKTHAHFERAAQQAVYRDGAVVGAGDTR
jgi:uncharacterized protein